MKQESSPAEKLKEIISTSGNMFHFKVASKLRSLVWSVTLSLFYNHTFSQKPREIDLIAEKAFTPVEDFIIFN